MRILNICTLLPYPLIDGGRISVYYPLKHLSARGHEITLACLSDRIDHAALRHMESLCTVVVQERSKKPSVKEIMRTFFSSVPYDIQRYYSPELMERVRALARTEKFDVVDVGLHSAWYGLALKGEFNLPVVLRVHNVHWVNFERSIVQWRNPAIKAYLWTQTKKLRHHELSVSAAVDLCLTVSDNDAEILRSFKSEIRCRTVPAGVELSQFGGGRMAEDPDSVLWMGSLNWIPNRDSFWWFYREIVPEIVRRNPQVRISVVGSKPPREILALRHPNVRVLGYVEDLAGVVQRSQVCVVPLRIGSGIRLKLLEMFAMRRAVVSTSVGCEGINVRHGEHLLVADTPEAFATAVVQLLADAPARVRLGDRAREHVAEHFDWKDIAVMFEESYASVISDHRHSGLREGTP